MLDFTGVKAITIPQGSVRKITRKSDGSVLWEKPIAFTNVLRLAATEYIPKEEFYKNNHAIYGEDYNADGKADGYITGTRIGSSGALTNVSGMCTSGFMPISYGDVLKIKNCSIKGASTPYLAWYQNGVFATVYPLANLTPDESGVYTYTSNMLYNDSVRLSIGSIDENTIVTINEEIPT